MTDVSTLGGGYAESDPDPGPTVAAVLAAARSGGPDAHLIVLGGPPATGKSSVAARLVQLIPNALWIDKDASAGGFIVEAARCQGLPASAAYGTDQYWQALRPLEYSGAMALACANLVDNRVVFLVGGWGPELAVQPLWPDLGRLLAPSRLTVVHLDAPAPEAWRARMRARGSRSDSPWFEEFAAAVTRLPVWEGASRIPTGGPLAEVVQRVMDELDRGDSPVMRSGSY